MAVGANRSVTIPAGRYGIAELGDVLDKSRQIFAKPYGVKIHSSFIGFIRSLFGSAFKVEGLYLNKTSTRHYLNRLSYKFDNFEPLPANAKIVAVKERLALFKKLAANLER